MILKNGKRLDSCSDTVPIGTLNPYMGSVAPYGYLICEGQLVNKITYKELYEICGDTFGEGTETEFRLPDLKGKTVAGYKEGDTLFGVLGKLIGSENHNHSISHTHGVPGVAHKHTTGNHTLTVAEMPSHSHGVTNNYGDFGVANGSYGVISNTNGPGAKATVSINNTGGSGAHNHGDTGSTTPATTTTNSQSTTTSGNTSSIQPTVVMNWIVKAFQLMPNQSYVENSLTSTSEINALSAAKGKELNEKFNNYLLLSGGKLTGALSFNTALDKGTDQFIIKLGESCGLGVSTDHNSIGLYGKNGVIIGSNSTKRILIEDSTSSIRPDSNNLYNLGTASQQWYNTYTKILHLGGTSYNYNGGSIPGVKEASAHNISDLINELRYTNGQMGSVNLTTSYDSIGVGWWLYLYIPHRGGGIDGKAAGNNCNWGVLVLIGMTVQTGQMFTINLNNGVIGSAVSH